tara:strand:- start:892 stop:3012 length:2121 start_codon:yes stop_codon:yes gene_type:complete
MDPNHSKDSENVLELSLGDVIGMVRERIVLGMTLGILFFSIGIGLYFIQTNQYQAESTMIINSSSNSLIDIGAPSGGSIGSGLGSGFLMEVGLRNQEAILNSKSFIKRLISSLSEKEKEALRIPFIEEDEILPDLFDIIEDSKKIVNASGSQIFTIIFKHPNPDMAVLLANKYAEEYISYVNEELGSSNKVALDFLENRAQELKDQLAQNELDLQSYREDNNIVSLLENQNIASAQIRIISERLNGIKLELLNLNTLNDQILGTLQNSQRLVEIPYIANFGDIPNLRIRLNELERELSSYNEILLEKHPKVLDSKIQIRDIKDSIELRINHAREELNNQRNQLTAQKESLSEDLVDAEKKKLAFDKVRIKFNVLERKSRSIEKTYDYIITRLHETQISSQLENTNIQIIDAATKDDKPVWPQKKIFALIAIILFGIGAFVVPIVLEFIDLRVKTVRDVEFHLGLKSIGVVPFSKEVAKVEKSSVQFVNETLHGCFNGLYKQIDLTSVHAPPKVMLISSILSSEGKSFLIASLALTYSRHGFKTLILDCDFRKPTQHKFFGLENSGGLLDCHKVETSMSCDPVNVGENLDLIVSGGTTHKTAEFFDNIAFKKFVVSMKNSYDIVFIDSPPASYYPDFLFLAEVSDEFILAVKYKEIKRDHGKYLVSQLHKSRVNVIGCILTMAPSSSNFGYTNYSYFGDEGVVNDKT